MPDDDRLTKLSEVVDHLEEELGMTRSERVEEAGRSVAHLRD